MTLGRRPIIAFAPLLFAAIGAAAAWHYANLDLTLSHYDARGHVIVARRITDSLTPGWRQFGALWLPLPHVLNSIPVRWFWNYQTGFSAVAINVLAMAAGLTALSCWLARRTGSVAAAIAATTIVLINPNVLYLQSTPMTEPLLFALCWLALDAIDRAIDHGPSEMWAGLWLALAVLTRYEAWPITAALVTIAALSRERRHRLSFFIRMAAWPASAAAVFLLLGRLAMGRWFADAGFFTPDNPAAHQPLLVLDQIMRGYRELAGPWLAGIAGVGVAISAWRAKTQRSLRIVLPLALAASVALPFIAFFDGHPFRVRYMVPLVAAGGAFLGLALAAIPRKWHIAASALCALLAVLTRAPLDRNAPMVIEAQRERPAQLARAPITAALAAAYDGTPILASMGSLGHYMQETSRIGLQLHNYVHEGNGDLWQAALLSPRTHAGWVLIEGSAEGGDQLSWMAKRDPNFLAGFSQVAAGGGATLFRRDKLVN